MSDRPNNQEDPKPDADSASSSSSPPPRRPAAPPPQARTHQHLDTDALSAFLDDRLDTDQRDEAAGHIAVCADCRRELRELRATVHLLHALPQYAPRRSFVLGSEYAHPVRTNRLIRFLPLLPAFRIAAAAVFVLLLGVGAADVLTEIGNDSDNNGDRTAQTATNPNDTAMLPAPTQSLVGDGTGGGGLAAGGDETGAKPTAPASSEGAGSRADASSNTARDADAAESDTDAAFDSESAAESSGVLEEDTGSDDEAAAGRAADGEIASESGASASEGEAPAMAAAQQSAPSDTDQSFSEEPAEDDASDAIAADSPPEAAAGGSAGGDVSLGEAAPPTASSTSTPRPSPTAAAVPTEATAMPSVSMADNGPTSAQKANGGSGDSLSTWRLIEFALAAVLIALALLVFSLQRLATRARKIGLVR